ncbi:hypothetical protein NMG60_11035694 [Bertholletia excelsa]
MGMLQKAKPYLLMVGLQCGSAGMFIISEITLKQGMSRYVLIVYRNSVAALTIAPFALFLERKIRPKMTVSIFLKIMTLAILEPILDQNLTYLGMKLTSASFASAIMNAVPAVTFAIAVLLRLEQVKIRQVRSQAKVVGTLVTFGGALLMTLYKGPIINLIWSPKTSQFVQTNSDSSAKHWLTGTLCILVGCAAWSSFFILQSITVKIYPAELSLAFWICFLGAVQSAALTLVAEHRPGVWSIGLDSRLLAPLYTGIISSGITYYVQGLVMKTRGPVFVTAFNPLCMIIVAILGSCILAEKLHLGSVIGAIIIAVGLYAVVWGKSKDQVDSSPITNQQELPVTTMNSSTPCAPSNDSFKLAEDLNYHK